MTESEICGTSSYLTCNKCQKQMEQIKFCGRCWVELNIVSCYTCCTMIDSGHLNCFLGIVTHDLSTSCPSCYLNEYLKRHPE